MTQGSRLTLLAGFLLAGSLLCRAHAGAPPSSQTSPTHGTDGPRLRTGLPEYDLAFTKALGITTADIKDGKFVAGESWDQVWTRDTSFSADLACALFHPAETRKTLLGLSENVEGIGDCWIQDECGHFGGWPNLTDAIVGALGAWAQYCTTGDRAFLAWAYPVTVHSLHRGERDAFDAPSGLFRGCSTFMESNSGYPKAYAFKGAEVGKTKALSTNLLYYQGYVIAARMAKQLGLDPAPHQRKADQLLAAIQNRLWLEGKGYYAYFEDQGGQVQDRMEGTGEAFSVLWGVAGPKADRVLTQTPTTPTGLPCLWPQYPEWTKYTTSFTAYYHNGMVWPFVQGYWGWAAASRGNSALLDQELHCLLALVNKNDTIMEFYFPENGAPGGSKRQLWSASGYLGLVIHGLFGMTFEPEGLRLAPVVPTSFANLELTGLSYRDMTLAIRLKGHGNRVEAITLDNRRLASPFVPGTLKGPHAVVIELR